MINIKQLKSDIAGPILFNGGNHVQTSSDLFWDNSNKRLGVNTDTPIAKIDISIGMSVGEDLAINASGGIPFLLSERSIFSVNNNGRLVANYDNTILASTYGHTFAAPNGAVTAFNISTQGLTGALFNMNTDGSFELGHIAAPVSKFTGDGINKFIFTGENGQSVGIQVSPTATLHTKGSTDDNTAYATKIDNFSGLPILYARNDRTVTIFTDSYTIMSGLDGYYPVRFKVGGSSNFWWSDGSGQSSMFIEDGTMQGIVSQLASGFGMLTGTFTNHDYIIRVNNSEALFIDKTGKVTVGGSGSVVAGITDALLSVWYSNGKAIDAFGRIFMRTFTSASSGDFWSSSRLVFNGTYNNGGGTTDFDADIGYEILSTTPTSKLSFRINSSELLHLKNNGVFEYNSDVSGNYTNLSLVDKQWVDNNFLNLAGGIMDYNAVIAWNENVPANSHDVSITGLNDTSAELTLSASYDDSIEVIGNIIYLNGNSSPAAGMTLTSTYSANSIEFGLLSALNKSYLNSGAEFKLTSTTMLFDGISSGYTGSEYTTKQAGVQTTNNTATTIASETLATNQMMTIKGIINGFRNDYTEAIGGDFIAIVRRVAGGAILVGSPYLRYNEDVAGTSPSFDLDVNGNDIRIRITGVTGKTYNWTVTYSFMKTNTNT